MSEDTEMDLDIEIPVVKRDLLRFLAQVFEERKLDLRNVDTSRYDFFDYAHTEFGPDLWVKIVNAPASLSD